ncbi:LysR family transcriptional regulator [Pseudomonas daroniae]|uniref:HTH-type transcriptional regulator TrpI n=1 Tax=Phytopseudomonas daroniae TaxID=2487519 RepID=A0A4Q9QHZ6_9GAMM|nr:MULTISPECIES: LysR family transcriptional regulator [Pseudomonas]TBU75032.1 LysR family transcriptional regulator [Pseudomonas daroniae]TBU80404.1 LysR family transcriptional regulator [Pseudomonas sp. FRB 228]TBU89131.1 LysR family transcriptional regulator [Pseudomonas daroniae]
MAQELPSLNALHAFEAAARLGSVSRAAVELHVTHGAVSRQIRTLEEQLGVALFVKEGRGLRLTEAGMRLRDVSGETFTRLRQVCGEIRQREVDTPFVLGCPGSLLARWFIPRLDRLNQALPELQLQLSTSQGELDPRSPQVDATLLYAEPPWPADMQVFELARESIGPVVSPRHVRFAELSEAAPGALLREALLHTTSRPQAWPQWAAAMGLEPAEMRLGQGFEHLYYLLEAASAGLGVAIAPLQLVADDLAAGRLAAPWGFVETEARLALWVPERRSGRRAEQLAQWLRTELQAAS